MATNDKRRQKKLERRNAKRKERQRTIVKLRNRGLGERLMAAAGAPILDCLMGAAPSICPVFLSRRPGCAPG